MFKNSCLFLFFLFFLSKTISQGCSTLGQRPYSAFPVCGVKTFNQSTVSTCTNNTIPVPGCSNTTTYTDKNPYWYRFTCYSSGSFEFSIVPINLSDDYDWQIFDITGHDPNDVYTDPSLFWVGNWSGSSGVTGASDTAKASVQCASDPKDLISTFSKSPNLIAGHTYLLMISHYTDTNQSGYSLSFTGGTANITDPNIPSFTKASGICGGDKIYIKLTKKILCNTIANNGSDFTLNPSTVGIAAAAGYGCSNNFDTDSIIVQLNNPLSPANYDIIQTTGTDGNTLVDNCNNGVPVNTKSTFQITSQQLIKAAFTYQINYGCKYDTAYFILGGNNAVNWTWLFDNSITNTVQNPTYIYKSSGAKTVTLTAYNSVCSDTATAKFILPDKQLKANFSGPDFACPNNASTFIDVSTGNIKNWNWDFGNGQKSSVKNPPPQVYPQINNIVNYPVMLSVSDSNNCSDTIYKLIKVVPNCYIAVPSAFTPNGDGLNDFLYPLNAYKAKDLLFEVFNRFGQIIFKTTDWTIKWDGTFKSIPQPSGVYVWKLNYTDGDTGEKIALKGTTVLIR